MSFSPAWLALREPADHRSRDAALARQLTAHFAGRAQVAVVDLGCGTGSNLRATAPLLGPQQHWTLVDYDERLLAAARDRLAAWADHTEADHREAAGTGLILRKAGQHITVAFRRADLLRELDAALGPAPDLVTASALFDLASPTFIQCFADAVVARGAAFYTVLTYNGECRWTPAHPADADVRGAFNRHQQTDKGLGGPAAGGLAPAILATLLAARGWRVTEGDSPWRLAADEGTLIAELTAGAAVAVAETGDVAAARLADWRALARTGAGIGHTDTLALPLAPGA